MPPRSACAVPPAGWPWIGPPPSRGSGSCLFSREWPWLTRLSASRGRVTRGGESRLDETLQSGQRSIGHGRASTGESKCLYRRSSGPPPATVAARADLGWADSLKQNGDFNHEYDSGQESLDRT